MLLLVGNLPVRKLYTLVLYKKKERKEERERGQRERDPSTHMP